MPVATRPLRVEELAEVLALDFDGAKDGIPALNKDWRWDDQKQGVLSTCSSLIVIDSGYLTSCPIVQFAHFSVKEFLTSDRLADLKADISHFHISLEPAHTTIAQACLGVLLLPDYNSDDHDEAKYNSPLTGYAAQDWVAHAQFENASFRVQVGMQRLFDPTKPYFAAWLKSYNIDRLWWSFQSFTFRENYAQDPASLCLYFASFCGFCDITKHLIAKYPQYVNASVCLIRSPLGAALYNNHLQVAELLCQHGASPDVIGQRGCTLLHAASSDGMTDVVQWLLNIGANANAVDDGYITPLHLAAGKGHLGLVQTLLRQRADIDAADEDNRTPLHEASAGGHVDIVRLLVQHGADASKDLQRLLLLASSSASAETVQFFIQSGADVNVRDENHSTPLHLASSTSGTIETMQLLIEHGANVHAQDISLSTPLHLASLNERAAKNVQLLIKNGADVHAQDQNHDTPLHLASSCRGNDKSVQLLIEHGADVHARDQSHYTPLHMASSLWGTTKTVQLLIKHGADIHARDESHSTPLHLASSSTADVDTVSLLIEHGADVHAQDQSHKTPLHLVSSCMGYFRLQNARLLIEHGADVHALDQYNKTPLHVASSWGEAEIVKLLIEHGADFHAQDQFHRTPLDLVSSYRQDDETRRVFMEHKADCPICRTNDHNHKIPLHLESHGEEFENETVQQHHRRDGTPRDPANTFAFASGVVRDELKLPLIEHRSDDNACDSDRSHSTPLHLEIVHQGPVAVGVEDDKGQSPFQIASSGGDHKIPQMLVSEYHTSVE